MIGAERLIFAFKDFVLSYLPYIGLAAAKTAVLEFNVAFLYIKTYMPALDIVIVYYSIASCIAVMSFWFIFSNSSMQQTPLSANINAPASITSSPVSGSFKTEAVKPAALVALPLVYTDRVTKEFTNFKN